MIIQCFLKKNILVAWFIIFSDFNLNTNITQIRIILSAGKEVIKGTYVIS